MAASTSINARQTQLKPREMELTLQSCEEALQRVDPADRATRVRIGEALRDEFGDEAFGVFDAWYSQHKRYTSAESKQAWRSFGKGDGKPCTIGTLIWEAKRGGFKFGKAHQVKRTPQERAQFEAERAARRAQLEAEAAAEQAEAAARAREIWDAADVDPDGHGYPVRKGVSTLSGVRRAREWVREWVDPETGEIRTWSHADPLLIPIWSAPGKLASLQAIFPSKCIGRGENARDKDYLKNGRKLGCYFLFGRITKDATLAIFCEGWATGASLHEATGLPVVVCFDAGNLEPVAAMMRSKLPALRMVFAADNDQFHPPEKGNPGVMAATKAAKAVGGIVAVPQFEDLTGRPKDFNDLQQLEGAEAICGVIDAALNSQQPEAVDTPADEDAIPSRIVLVPTEDEAMGASWAYERLALLGDRLTEWELAAGKRDAGHAADPRDTMFVSYADFGLERAAMAIAHVYPGVELHILAGVGDEAEAHRVGQLYGAQVSEPDSGDDWRGWGECLHDLLDARADADPAALEFAERAIEQARGGDEGEAGPAKNGYFTILGLDHAKYFIFKHNTGQVASITKSDLTDAGLIELAPLNWWEANFAGNERSGGIDRKAAINFIVRRAEERGIYDPSHIRGRGAWSDEGRAIYHHGGHLSVDGVRKDVAEIESDYVYERTYSLPEPHDTGLTTAEGDALLGLMCRFRWSMPASALLFGGWIALAPVCGALPWRPHLWITGGAGSGKSTIAKMAHDLLRGTDVFAQGSSTEPGIRQRLKGDARPVLMDESESIEEGDAKRIQSILALIRQASTESDAETLKGTADGSGMTYHIRSMFCLASIQVALKNKADIDRLSVLTLRSGRDAKSDPNEWKSLKDAIHALVGHDPTVSRRLLRRSIDLLPTTLQNIDVFTEVGARVFGSQRDGDQYGTLLAGAWSLISDDVASPAQAEEMIKGYDWSEHLEAAEEDDSQRALNAMLGAFVRMDTGETSTLSDLISVGAGRYDGGDDIRLKDAKKKLGQLGLKVEGIEGREYLFVSNENAEREKLMRDTPFKVGAKKMLMRLPGAMTGERARGRSKNKTRFPGLASPQYYFVVPLDVIFGDEANPRTRPDAVAESETETEPF